MVAQELGEADKKPSLWLTHMRTGGLRSLGWRSVDEDGLDVA